MTENEQINKIAREICHLRAEYITCEECNKECCIDEDELCYFQCMAKEIISHNYRKVERGEWGFDGSGWTCSECGEYALCDKHGKQMLSNNCPNCGADMRGKKNENSV